MRMVALPLIVALLISSPAAAAEFPTATPAMDADVSVCFRPGPEDCEREIAAAIDAARGEVLVQAYGFTSIAILDALVAAKRRGVDVELVLDKTNAEKRYAGARLMALAGCPVWIDNQVTIAHNKLIIIDGWEVIGGSFNYTKSAETRNAENVTFISSPDVASSFKTNWQARRAQSQRYALD